MKDTIVILLLALLALLLRVYLIWRSSVPFAYDMGRDLLWVKDISFYHSPTLIGPAASIWGVYFQPFWYYFLGVPLLITKGDPLSAVYATAATVLLTGVLSFILFRKYLPKIYIFTLAALLLFSSNLINISTFAFHANLLPLLTILATYFIFLSVIKNPLYLIAASFFISLMFSADPEPAAVFTLTLAFIFFYFRIYKSRRVSKVISLSIGAYFAPFLPQILFEIRNNFIQTKSLFSYFSGNNPSLSGQLPLLERIPNRAFVYFDFIKASFAPQNVLALVLIVFVLTGLYRLRKSRDFQLSTLLKLNMVIFVTSFLLNTLINVEIKNWYLYGITTNAALLIVLALYGVKSRVLTSLFLIIFLIANLLPFAENEKIEKSKRDPAQLSNQLQVLDLIYKDANTPFSVYVYTPSVYDLNYQYLFWWQGIEKSKGLPQDFAYLPGKPDYVRNKSKYFINPKTANTAYLIIENASENEFYTSQNWQTNFADYKIVWEKDINGAINIQKRQK